MAHEIRNISSAGFYLVTKERWHPGTVITMTLQRTECSEGNSGTEHYISVLSKVIRLDKEGVGFAFIPLETKEADLAKAPRSKPAGKKALSRFLERLKLDHGSALAGLDPKTEEGMRLGQDASSRTPGENMMKGFNDESGQAMVTAILCMTCLFGFFALAADVGIMLHEKRLAQIAADSGAVAGALELNFSDVTTAARAAAAQNGFVHGTNGATVTVNGTTGPAYGAHAGDPNYVEVIASQSQRTFFMGFFGRRFMTVSARAVATAGTTNGCIYTLGTTGPDFSITGNSNIQIQTCGIIDNSSSNNALSLTGNATLDAQSIGIVGGYSKTGNVTISPTPVTGIVPTSDPLSFLPAPTVPSSCSADPNLTGNITRTLTPGCYNGLTATGNINLTLSPGLYIFNGQLNLTGNVSLSGTGVTLDLLGSTSIPGNVALNLTAPTSGTYDGVVIYQPSSNTNTLGLTGNSGSTFQGIVYAPSAAVTLTGNSGSNIYADFVVKSLNLVGNSSLNDYASINGSSVLSAVKLVE
jgi:hypothetical protein